MRTKTLLLSAVALAAGIVASQAQTSNVYSANVVGYVNVVLPGGGQYQLCANPFDDGNGNYLTNVMGNSLPKQSQVLIWNGAGYDSVLRGGTPAVWPVGTTNQVPPGVGFFVKNGGVGAPNLTNTFVGSVVVQNGSSVTNNLNPSYTLVGSPIPYAGNLAISGQGSGDANMDYGSPLGKASQILVWNYAAQTYSTVVSKGGSANTWNGTASITPGQGFFVKNQTSASVTGPQTNVVETLNLQ